MAKRIYKYALRPFSMAFEVEMPKDADVLTVQVQYGEPHIWAIVDPDEPPETRGFVLRGTGHGLKGNEGRYVGTFQLEGGAFVGHLFEALP